MSPGADQAVHVGLGQRLRHGLRNTAPEIASSSFGQQFGDR